MTKTLASALILATAIFATPVLADPYNPYPPFFGQHVDPAYRPNDPRWIDQRRAEELRAEQLHRDQFHAAEIRHDDRLRDDHGRDPRFAGDARRPGFGAPGKAPFGNPHTGVTLARNGAGTGGSNTHSSGPAPKHTH